MKSGPDVFGLSINIFFFKENTNNPPKLLSQNKVHSLTQWTSNIIYLWKKHQTQDSGIGDDDCWAKDGEVSGYVITNYLET